MYRWYIKFVLKNGIKHYSVAESKFNDLGEFAEDMFQGKDLNSFFAIVDYENEKSQLFIRFSEVCSFSISEKPFEKE